MTNNLAIKHYALISVFNKTNIVKLAKAIIDAGFIIIATEGTGSELSINNIPYIKASDFTKNPTILTDCIQTISFRVQGGILFDKCSKKHTNEIMNADIVPIDIVICNFTDINQSVKNISDFNIKHVDLGGPLMIKAAAINYKYVLTVIDYNDYDEIIDALLKKNITEKMKMEYAIKAFLEISKYDNGLYKYLFDKKSSI